MGYGSRALKALNSFYSGEYFNLDEASRAEPSYPDAATIDKVRSRIVLIIPSLAELCCKSSNLLTDNPTVRSVTAMPPLLQRLTERKPETLDYLGVSYGLTPQLLRCVSSYHVNVPFLKTYQLLEESRLCPVVHSTNNE